ncbi:MAG: hypothetical protein KJ069_26980 [Anaerolineae bacterium]|nr:hypothetical protein [Anaerolineae bacterium]
MRTYTYLDNLVARSLPETAVIQPRPVSLFEPWPGTIPFSTPAMTEDQTAVAQSEPHPLPRPQAQPFSPAPYPAETAVPPSAAPATAVPPAPVKSATLPAPASQPTATHRAGQHHLPKVAPSDASQPTLPVQPANIPVIRPSSSAPITPRPAPPDHPTEPRPAREVHTTVTIREQTTKLTPVPETAAKTKPMLAEVVREQPIQPAPPTAIPVQTKPFTPASNRPTNHQPVVTKPAEPTPTVQITIGRIEVRATPPPPAKAEKKQPSAPMMSLDDYLRQRNGGRP